MFISPHKQSQSALCLNIPSSSNTIILHAHILSWNEVSSLLLFLHGDEIGIISADKHYVSDFKGLFKHVICGFLWFDFSAVYSAYLNVF